MVVCGNRWVPMGYWPVSGGWPTEWWIFTGQVKAMPPMAQSQQLDMPREALHLGQLGKSGCVGEEAQRTAALCVSWPSPGTTSLPQSRAMRLWRPAVGWRFQCLVSVGKCGRVLWASAQSAVRVGTHSLPSPGRSLLLIHLLSGVKQRFLGLGLRCRDPEDSLRLQGPKWMKGIPLGAESSFDVTDSCHLRQFSASLGWAPHPCDNNVLTD